MGTVEEHVSPDGRLRFLVVADVDGNLASDFEQRKRCQEPIRAATAERGMGGITGSAIGRTRPQGPFRNGIQLCHWADCVA